MEGIKIRGLALILAVMVVSSSIVFAQLIQTSAPIHASTDTRIQGIDMGLVTDVGKASQDFVGDITEKINISDEELGEKGAIDDLIILMGITLEFTSKVINIVQDKELGTGRNSTHNETNLIADEKMAEALQYLMFLQSEDPCREAINKFDENRKRNLEEGLKHH